MDGFPVKSCQICGLVVYYRKNVPQGPASRGLLPYLEGEGPRKVCSDCFGKSGDTPLFRSVGRIAPFLNQSNRSEEHTSELQSRGHLVCRLLLEKKKQK